MRKAFVVGFSNRLPWGAGTRVEEEFLILAEDITEALVKATDAVAAIRAGLNDIQCGLEPIRREAMKEFIDGLRLTKVEEQFLVLNPDNDINQELIRIWVSSAKEDFEDK
jgi:hypothetical protein